MGRYKLVVEYDGAPFTGWQRVNTGPSVQAALEAAAAALCGAPCAVIGAGRTDSGVHAQGQVAHLDLEKPFRPDRLRDALNAHLRPAPIAVLHAAAAPAHFHARFSAVRRTYCYRILNRRAPPALARGRAWQVMKPLDGEAMAQAFAPLLGRHDFTTFRDAQCQAQSPVRTLERLEVRMAGEEVEVWCAARSFLHRQVRSMVGTLVEAGLGRRSPASVGEALAARDRAACGRVAPPDGLFLMAVDYPASAEAVEIEL